MDNIRTCNNNCIFCFISQLPPGLRSSLYIRDDDYLLSYMYSNFITLTNISYRDINKIIKADLSPLYVSVHSLDKKIRRKIFGRKKDDRGLEYLGILDNAGINTHIQIVLVPGLNDGCKLVETLKGLISGYRNILSIGIVPAGITKFNKNRSLIPLNCRMARHIIALLEDFKASIKGLKLANNIGLSDEFYLIAGKPFPPEEYYGSFFQIENGIGKSRNFMDEVKKYTISQKSTGGPIPDNPVLLSPDIITNSNGKREKILLITSEYGHPVISAAVEFIIKNIDSGRAGHDLYIELLTVKNRFLGGNIKTTGLLCGTDIMNEITSKISGSRSNKFTKIIIPDCIFNRDGLTIDEYTRHDIEKTYPGIKIIAEKGADMARAIFDLQ